MFRQMVMNEIVLVLLFYEPPHNNNNDYVISRDNIAFHKSKIAGTCLNQGPIFHPITGQEFRPMRSLRSDKEQLFASLQCDCSRAY